MTLQTRRVCSGGTKASAWSSLSLVFSYAERWPWSTCVRFFLRTVPDISSSATQVGRHPDVRSGTSTPSADFIVLELSRPRLPAVHSASLSQFSTESDRSQGCQRKPRGLYMWENSVGNLLYLRRMTLNPAVIPTLQYNCNLNLLRTHWTMRSHPCWAGRHKRWDRLRIKLRQTIGRSLGALMTSSKDSHLLTIRIELFRLGNWSGLRLSFTGSTMVEPKPVSWNWRWSVFLWSRRIVPSSHTRVSFCRAYIFLSSDPIADTRKTSLIEASLNFLKERGDLMGKVAQRIGNLWMAKNEMLGAIISSWSSVKS